MLEFDTQVDEKYKKKPVSRVCIINVKFVNFICIHLKKKRLFVCLIVIKTFDFF